MLIGARKWMVLLLYTSYVNVALFWVFALSLILSSPTNLPRVALGLLYVANGALALPFLEPFRRACVAIRDLASADPQRCVSAFVLEHCTIYRRMGIFLCIVFGLTLLALVAILLLALSRRH